MDYKLKYLKYKNKYLKLKINQKGGAMNRELDLDRNDNKYIQELVLRKSILIAPELNIEDSNNLPFSDYQKMLVDLMKYGTSQEDILKIPENELNLNFLNTISAFPADLRSNINIVTDGNENGKNKYKFTKNINYEISNTISDRETGSNAVILNLRKINGHASLPESLVLKLMPINFKEYYNYTPLSFQHISDTSLDKSMVGMNPRYYQYTPSYYENISFDKNYKGFNNLGGEQLHVTATDLDDFKNEMIQNIICKNILGEDNKNLINYYNFMYITIDGNIYGGILMERVDGSLDKYILDNKNTILTNDKFRKSLIKYINELKKLKNAYYRFNHGDLKLQNIFYKEEDGELIFKIADLDKSSITFNGIRFINGKLISKSFDFLKGGLVPFDIRDNNIHIPDRISGYAGIELEQIFLRYSFFPAPPFYDFLMLFICLKIYFYNKISEFLEYIIAGEDLNSVTNLLNSFLGDGQSIIKMTEPINEASQNLVGETNFGDIVFGTLISNHGFMGIPLNFEYPHEEREHNIVRLSQNLKLVLTTTSSKYIIDQKFVKSLVNRSITWKSNDRHVNKIFYTGNTEPPVFDIVKTNRYTNKRVLLTILYEWDYIGSSPGVQKLRDEHIVAVSGP